MGELIRRRHEILDNAYQRLQNTVGDMDVAKALYNRYYIPKEAL